MNNFFEDREQVSPIHVLHLEVLLRVLYGPV